MVLRGSRRTIPRGTKMDSKHGGGWFSRRKSHQHSHVGQSQEEHFHEEAMVPFYETREDIDWQELHQHEEPQPDNTFNFFGVELAEQASQRHSQRIIYSLPHGMPSQLVLNEDDKSAASSTLSESLATNESAITGPVAKSSNRQLNLDQHINQIDDSGSTDESEEDFEYQPHQQLPQRRSIFGKIFRKQAKQVHVKAQQAKQEQEEAQHQQPLETSSSSNEEETEASSLSVLSDSSTHNSESQAYLNERTRKISERNIEADFRNKDTNQAVTNERNTMGQETLATINTEENGNPKDSPPYQNAILQSFGGGLAGIFGTGTVWASPKTATSAPEENVINPQAPSRGAEPDQEASQLEQNSSLLADPETDSQMRQNSLQLEEFIVSNSLEKHKRRSCKLLLCSPGGDSFAREEARLDEERQIEQRASMLSDESRSLAVGSSSGQVERLTDEELLLLQKFRRSKSQLIQQSGPHKKNFPLSTSQLKPTSSVGTNDVQDETLTYPTISTTPQKTVDHAQIKRAAEDMSGERALNPATPLQNGPWMTSKKHAYTSPSFVDNLSNAEEKAMYASTTPSANSEQKNAGVSLPSSKSRKGRRPRSKRLTEEELSSVRAGRSERKSEKFGDSFSELKNQGLRDAPEEEVRQLQHDDPDTDTDDDGDEQDRYMPAARRTSEKARQTIARPTSIPDTLPKMSWRKQYMEKSPLKEYKKTSDDSSESAGSFQSSDEYLSSPRLASLQNVLFSDSERHHMSYMRKLSRASNSTPQYETFFWQNTNSILSDTQNSYDDDDFDSDDFSSSGSSTGYSSLEAFSTR